MPLRITYVIPTLDQSGAERQLTLLATSLPRDEFTIDVIALNRGGYFEKELRAADLPVTILEKRFRFDPLTFVRLRRQLRETKPDIVQSYLFSANSYVRFPGVCPSGIKVVVSERCVDSWKSGWQLHTDRWLSNRMDAMTVNSASVGQFYRTVVGVDEQKIVVIPNGVPSPAETPHATDLRKQLSLSPDSRVLGFAGRLAPQKCLQDLVWAFHLLKQAIDEAVLVIVGDGPERDRLADFATNVGCRDRVFFTGHRSDAAALISQFDAFCLPSSFEGMSNSLTEAMSVGVPVIASDIPANAELVTHEETGLLVSCGDSVAICKAAQRLFSDSDFAFRLSASARVMIKDRFSIQQMVQAHTKLYQRLSES